MKIRKKLSTVLIILGIFIIFFPKLQEKYYDYKQKQILKDIEIVENEPKTKDNTTKNIVKNETKGNNTILIIDKINLKQPILSGATKDNMAVSVATINPQKKAGDIGNYSIAGHRSYTYGRNFNRLGEVTENDVIKVVSGNSTFQYKITKKFLVKPDEVWVLDDTKDKKQITLVTCEPMYNPTHRMIIQGELF
ncbi:class D sortase [Hathewaya histolytica]|uniref:class D sortase n=1 Tax=Hathewaya histolytica TaxID=1498 RepID=UPI003B683EAE